MSSVSHVLTYVGISLRYVEISVWFWDLLVLKASDKTNIISLLLEFAKLCVSDSLFACLCVRTATFLSNVLFGCSNR